MELYLPYENGWLGDDMVIPGQEEEVVPMDVTYGVTVEEPYWYGEPGQEGPPLPPAEAGIPWWVWLLIGWAGYEAMKKRRR